MSPIPAQPPDDASPNASPCFSLDDTAPPTLSVTVRKSIDSQRLRAQVSPTAVPWCRCWRWGEQPPVRAECHISDPVGVAGEGTQAVATWQTRYAGLFTGIGSDTCYVKFGAVRLGPGAERRFGLVIDACHRLAANLGASVLVAGANVGRDRAGGRWPTGDSTGISRAWPCTVPPVRLQHQRFLHH